MKLRKIYESILNEGKQVGIVYHFTSLNSAIGIIEKNWLKAYKSTKNLGQTVSTTRDKRFSKSRLNQTTSIMGDHICFVIDGNKMSNVYQVKPYDDTVYKDGTVSEPDREAFGDEQEEVWYGKRLEGDGGIKNFSNYVIKVILTRKLLNVMVDSPKKLIPVDNNQVTDKIGNVDDINVNIHQRLKSIKDFFEGKGFTVEIEKM